MTLRVASDLRLPLEVAGEAIAILAKRGAGKTNTATVLVEELLAAGVQTVVLDPVSAWWGLRWNADGDKAAHSVPILGGPHGDVPLQETAGALIADVVVDSGQSLVIDLSDLPSKASMGRFVVDFAERLYRRKGGAKTPLHLVLEEADTFAPQRVRSGDAHAARMQAAIEQIVRRGRSRGMGVTLITQRSAVLSKDVLTQADVLVVMRTTGPHDLKAIREWIDSRGDERGKGVLESLPSLATGEAWVWNPEHDLLSRVQIRRRKTFDSSETPKAGQTRAEPTARSEIDVTALGEQIAATAEAAKAADPKELHRRIRALEAEVTEARTVAEAIEPVEVIVEVPVLDGQIPELEAVVNAMRDQAKALDEHVGAILTKADRIIGAIHDRRREDEKGARRASTTTVRPRADAPAVKPRQRVDTRPARPAREAAPTRAGDTRPESIAGPEQRILDALAWLEALRIDQGTKVQVAFLAGYKPSGGRFGNLLGSLRGQGLIEYPRTGMVALTEEGRATATDPDLPPTNEGLHEAVLARLDVPQGKILRILLDYYPEMLPRDSVASGAGYEASGGRFGNLLGSLRSLGLIDYPTTGYVRAEGILFPEDA